MGELRGIWVLPSPWILKPIIHDEFWQGITVSAPKKWFCFIFTIPVYFIHSTIKVLSYYFVFIYLIFIFQRNAPYPTVPWCYTLKWHKHRTLWLEGVNVKDTNLPCGSVSTFKSQMKQGKHPFVWLSPREKKLGSNQLFLIWRIWSWLIRVSVKILITLLWFRQKFRCQILF